MSQLAMLGFLAPWMAWGAVAAVGLPVLAHLLGKTRYREVLFPAARLVQQAVAATSRIETPRHRLLMLLRWLVLMLLVLAFMRPQWTPDAEAGPEREAGIALVVMIDASASMQRIESGASLYDRAVREAERLINQLDPMRDVAAVITVDHAPKPLLPEATAQFSLLTKRLSTTEPGYSHANWPGAVAAMKRLTNDQTRTLRVITLSDQQGERPDADLDHIRLHSPTDNAAIRLVDVRPYPATQGQPVTATIEARQFGDQPLIAKLSAGLAGSRVEQSLDLAPGATQRITLRFAGISESGLLRVDLDHTDAIDADNSVGLWLPVQSRTRALIVHDRTASSEAIAKRLATLLSPGDLPGVTLPEVDLLTVDDAQAALALADPAVLRTVVLINRSPLPDAASQSLEAYAQAGGGVVEFVMSDAGGPGQTTTAAGIDFDLEPLRIFEGPARAGLATLPWPGVRNTPIDERAQPILLDAMERVIIAEMPRGRGRLIAINASLSAEAGGLLAEPAFVVLFNELCRYASPGPAMPTPAKPGDPLASSLRNAAQIRSPTGTDTDANTYTTVGAYAALDERGEVQALTWSALDPGESDTSASPAWSNATAQSTGNAPASNSGFDNTATLRQDPIELWPYLIFMVLGLVAAESLLLRQFAGPRPSALQGGTA